MKMLTRQGHLIEEQGMAYMGNIGPNNPRTLAPCALTSDLLSWRDRAQREVALRDHSGSAGEYNRALIPSRARRADVYELGALARRASSILISSIARSVAAP
ncbi:MAG: hypothetical protein ACKVQA_18730 [Burkholderiales bacterium]